MARWVEKRHVRPLSHLVYLSRGMANVKGGDMSDGIFEMAVSAV